MIGQVTVGDLPILFYQLEEYKRLEQLGVTRLFLDTKRDYHTGKYKLYLTGYVQVNSVRILDERIFNLYAYEHIPEVLIQLKSAAQMLIRFINPSEPLYLSDGEGI